MNYPIECLSIGKNNENNFVIGYLPRYFVDTCGATRMDVIKNELIKSDYNHSSFIPLKSFIKHNKGLLANKYELTQEDVKLLSYYIKTEKFSKIYNKISKSKKSLNY